MVIGSLFGDDGLQFAASGASATGDVVLWRQAADVLMLSRSASPQCFKIGNTYAGANFELGVIDWKTTANTLRIGAEAGGTGTLRDVVFVGASHKCQNGFAAWDATPPATQPAAIADVPTSGSATAADNATAINSILAALRGCGLIAS